jgi:tetratricopeptide (TPR) repeat protein
MSKMLWPPFPQADARHRYPGTALKTHWSRLHRGDREPWPASAAVQEAWRLYHAGEFQKAHDAGIAAGLDGYNAANKAAMIHANYLETDAAARQARFQAVVERCAELQRAQPGNANAHYLQAYALGRHSQGISVVKALAQGLGGRIQAALEATLRLDEQHADAHCALAAFQAEVIDKVGALVGRLSYGASRDSVEAHFHRALALAPEAAIFAVEQANALVLLHGQGRMAEALKLYQRAAACVPMDAMERLDVEMAKAKAKAKLAD